MFETPRFSLDDLRRDGADDRRHDRVAGAGGDRAGGTRGRGGGTPSIPRSDANMPVISSAMEASCSPVARSAARPAAPTSSSRRRLVDLVEGQPVEGGQELERGPARAGGGPSTMNVRPPRGSFDDAPSSLQRAQARAEGGTADAHRPAMLPLRGEPLARARPPRLISRRTCSDDLERHRSGVRHVSLLVHPLGSSSPKSP